MTIPGATVPRSVRTWSEAWVSWSVTALVVIPLVTVFLPQRLALPTQAALVVVILSSHLFGFWRGGLPSLRATPRAVVAGLTAYGAAAVWGVVVGVASGNPLRYVASQAVSMLLLPAGFTAYRLVRSFDGTTLVTGLSRAYIVAAAVHLSAFAIPWLRAPAREEVFRFVLRNNVSVLGTAVLGWILLVAAVALGCRRRMVIAGLFAASILIVGGMSRGAWITVVIGLVVISLLGRPAGRVRRVLAVLCTGAVAIVGLVVFAAWAWQPVLITRLAFDAPSDGGVSDNRDGRSSRSGELRLAPLDRGGRRVRLVHDLAIPTRNLEISWTCHGEPGTSLNFTAVFESDDTTETRRFTGLVVGEGGWSEFRTVVAAPPHTTSLTMWISAGRRSGPWRIQNVEISGIESRIGAWSRQLLIRASSMARSWTRPTVDGGVRYRVEEARVVLDQLGDASGMRRMVGAGLGATIPFEGLTWDDRGRRITGSTASYLHSFYLFLMFKLGLMGVVALLGLAAIVWWTVRSLLWFRSSGRTPAILLGSAASWLAFLVWSTTSPEIYDFMMAPLWGAMVAACVRRVDIDTTDARSERERPPSRSGV